MRQANLKTTLEFHYSIFLSWQVFTREISVFWHCWLTARKSSCLHETLFYRNQWPNLGKRW